MSARPNDPEDARISRDCSPEGSPTGALRAAVVTEAKTARESSFVENVGTYNPRLKPAKVEINKERLEHWLKRGAQPSDSVRTLIKKHLTRDLSTPVATPAAQ